jgi:hypothetical protein
MKSRAWAAGSYMSRQDLIDNFGEEKGKKIELDHKPKADGNQGGQSTAVRPGGDAGDRL